MKRLFPLLVLILACNALLANNITTSFPSTENPISQGGTWINGAATGVDWSNIATNANGAYGTQLGSGGTNDSIAVLTGVWGADQTVTETVRTTNQPSGNVFEEFECLVRFTITAHSATGYEILFSTNKNYVQIVRWNGAFNTFEVMAGTTLATLSTGNVVKATITGTAPPTITAYLNNSSVLSITDNGSHGGAAYTTGNPGMGMYYQDDSSGGVPADYSITTYTATDGQTTVTSAASRGRVHR